MNVVRKYFADIGEKRVEFDHKTRQNLVIKGNGKYLV